VSGVRVIGFDVTVDGKPHGEARIDELKWLEKELMENRSKKLIIVFTHQLLMPTTTKDTTQAWSFWMVKNSTRVRDVLKAYPNVRLVISGHHHVSKVETAGRITYVSDPPSSPIPARSGLIPSAAKGSPEEHRA
jgi:3',5'-cyclic AMP phosphodiesterase CpdA